MNQKIKLTYYTDPLCSTCWSNEPYFRKLVYEYGHLLDIKYKMGGLLPSWKTYKDPSNQIKGPSDLVIPWNNLGKISGMSLDGDVWIDDPILSSYPASLAFYAAQIQSKVKAKKLIRKLRELLFLYKKNIAKIDVILLAVNYLKLNKKQFLKDFRSLKVNNQFKKDIKEKELLGINSLPAFIFSNANGDKIILNTCYDFFLWEDTIQKLSSTKLSRINSKPSLDRVLKDTSLLSTAEIAILLGTDISTAEKDLLKMEQNSLIKHIQFKYAKFWHNMEAIPIISDGKAPLTNIAIIGAGLAGLCAAICLNKEGRDVRLIEASAKKTEQGLGFILMPNGVTIFKKLGLENQLFSQGNKINKFVLLNPKGQVIQKERMNTCVAISRATCINILLKEIPQKNIHFEKKVKNYSRNARGITLNFDDNTKIKTNLVISSEGTNSSIRKLLFPDLKGVEIKEKEIVGMAYAPELAKELGNTFYKVNNAMQGFNMGIIASGENEVIWFIQINQEKIAIPDNTAVSLEKFSSDISNMLPDQFKEAIKKTNFSEVYLWKLYDVDLLPAFHKDGIVLIGDAAHPLLSFTSQGASTALEDAYLLSELINKESSTEMISSVYENFYTLRKSEINDYINFGRLLLDQFINPENYKGYNVPYIDYGSK